MYVYFTHSFKKHMEFTKLVENLETRGRKIFRNMKIKWILMLALAKHVLQEYNTLVVKMADDSFGNATTKTTMSRYVIVTLSWD